MNRDDFKSLAEIRLSEAKTLLDNGMYDGAYYLCGYVVEFALKACIAKKTNQYDFPPNQKTANQIYSHKFDDLLGAAGLKVQFHEDLEKDKDLEINWNIVSPWNESSRYEKWSEEKARAMYDAITDCSHGVRQWIIKYW